MDQVAARQTRTVSVKATDAVRMGQWHLESRKLVDVSADSKWTGCRARSRTPRSVRTIAISCAVRLSSLVHRRRAARIAHRFAWSTLHGAELVATSHILRPSTLLLRLDHLQSALSSPPLLWRD